MVGTPETVTVKVPPAAIPESVLTVTGPVVAPAGTTTVSCVGKSTLTALSGTGTPLNRTTVRSWKLEPAMTTRVPMGPVVVDRPVTTGAGTVKLVLLYTVPPSVCTEIGPDVTCSGTSARICVGDSTSKVAPVPLNSTKIAPVKLVPSMRTSVSTDAELGEKPEM